MSNDARISAECLTPILYVRDFAEAMNYYTEKLLFERLWDWGDPPSFGAVRLGKVEIFFCLGDQGLPGHVEAHTVIAQDEMREYRKHRFAREALHPPDGEPTQPHPGIVRVARQAATRATVGFVEELKPRREEEGENKLDKRLGVVQEPVISRFVVEIDGDRAVGASRFGGLSHVASPCRGLSVTMRHRERNALKDQA